MNKLLIPILSLSLISLIGCSEPKPTTVTISPIGNEMKFNITEFTVKPKQEVTLIMKNVATSEAMKHNVMIIDSFSNVKRVAEMAQVDDDYVPEDSAIIAATAIAEPGHETQIKFTAPEKIGDYPYICSYPGHYIMMKGVMKVKK